MTKGDIPLFGDKVFFSLTGVLDNFVGLQAQPRLLLGWAVPERAVPRAQHPRADHRGRSSWRSFHGDTVFTPKDWAHPARARSCGSAAATTTPSTTAAARTSRSRKAFGELKLFEIGETFDATSARGPVQGFNSDFFGLIYNDVQPGARFFSEIARNQFKVNLAAFDRLNKEKLSGAQRVRQAARSPGGRGGLPVGRLHPARASTSCRTSCTATTRRRPSSAAARSTRYYFGFATNGHIDRFNVNSAFYYVTGTTARNTPNLRQQDISA